MNKKERIAVIGVGGVGGYLAGMLGKKYEKVTLVARGKRKNALKKDGLVLDSDYHGRFVVDPYRIVPDASDLDEQDFIFICVKNYSLMEVCDVLGPAVLDHTILVPVMNGVDPADRVRRYVNRGIVVDALIYIIASAGKDYTIRQIGEYADVHIGTKDDREEAKQAAERVHRLLKDAHIDSIMEPDIESAIWQKYILNCAYNMLTAYYDCSVEAIRSDPKRMEEYQVLLEEAIAVADKKGICLPRDIFDRHLDRMVSLLSPDATSSLKRDIAAGKNSELEAFGGYLTAEARELGVAVPLSRKLYDALKSRVGERPEARRRSEARKR